MEHLQIREIFSQQLVVYRAFLNVGLVEDEESFRITPTDDADAPFPTKDREDSFTLGAYIGESLAGVVSFMREGGDREKLRHKGLLFRMYVAKNARGRGVAKMLIQDVIARVKGLDDIEQINLTVIANNEHAKTLYEKIGFVSFGSEYNAIKWNGKYFTEELMVLRIKQG